MKILVMPTTSNQYNLADGIIIGIKGLSVNIPLTIEIEEITKINTEIFVSLNKNMFKDDLNYLEQILVKLNNTNIKGVMFYDLSIINISKKYNFKYDLIWHQEHMVTSSLSISIYNQMKIKAWVSNDITLREMQEIKKESKDELFACMFGYLPIFASKRPLVTNYLKTNNLKGNSTYIIHKENKNYQIIEDKNGTFVYTDFILDGLKETENLNYEYIILNSFSIPEHKFKEVVYQFVNKKYDYKLSNLFDNLGKGNLYQNTVYKVK